MESQPTARKLNTSTGRRIYTWRTRRELFDEIDERLRGHIENGASSPWWGEGVLVRHIVLGLLEPVSLCGRFVGSVSSTPMVTLVGKPCNACRRRWNRVMNEMNAQDADTVSLAAAVAVADAILGHEPEHDSSEPTIYPGVSTAHSGGHD